MFANRTALETLVRTDTMASEDEKSKALALLYGVSGDKRTESVEDRRERLLNSIVVGLDDAAWLLGDKSRFTVYAMLRRGALVGYYGGDQHKRASGIKVSSIVRCLDGKRRCEKPLQRGCRR